MKTWKEALKECRQEGVELSEELIIQMFKMDLLCAYKKDDFKVGFNLSFKGKNQLQATTIPITEVDVELLSSLDTSIE